MVALALILNIGGLADLAIQRVTSRNLGELAPGYAATESGLRVYGILILTLGLVVTGFGLSLFAPIPGAVAIGLGLVGFVVASVVAIAGEVSTFRALRGRANNGR